MAEMLDWVIVVEIDPLVRSLLVEWLEEIGPRVLAFEGPQALPVIGACLVVVDLVNVRQQGADIIRRVRTLYPGVPLLGLSTQAREGMAVGSEAARNLGVDMLLPKPCERLLLQRAVRALMAGN
ncbi:response regulator [Hylemonella gracilis]|uniref:Response regulator n=1 Tax=Hylemonella gracilis TaxID=80880 RepID=A0A4P6ULH7_9BURK|nr:response regulator [Hylemonella gracilis]QBK06052.1 response regulator [Hylemonella gracilis]